MTSAARSPLPGAEPSPPPDAVSSGPTRRRRGPKARAASDEPREESSRRSRASKPALPGSDAPDEPVGPSIPVKPAPADSDGDDSRKVTLRLPGTVAERIAKLADDRGVSRGQLAGEIMERGLHMDGSRFVLPGGEGREVLEHVGTAPPESPEIPRGYVGQSADEGGEDEAPSAGPGSGSSGAAPAADREEEPEAGLLPSLPAVGPVVTATALAALSRAFRSVGVYLGLALLMGLLGVALALVAPRYGLHAPAPGPYASGAYLVDRWTGRVWFCDSAIRGLPARGCAPFLRGLASPGEPSP